MESERGREIKKTMIKNRILIVDGEYDINLLFKMVLEDNGFKVDTFNDPLVALQNFRASSYDLLLLDMLMPKMNGFELYQKEKSYTTYWMNFTTQRVRKWDRIITIDDNKSN